MPRFTDTFWSKVLFKDFIRHFRKMSDEQIVRDINDSMDALENLDCSGESFGSLMVQWANDRKNGSFASAARENGAKGGRPRKNGDASTGDGEDGSSTGAKDGDVSTCVPLPRSFKEVAEFAGASGLDYDDTRLWWQRNFVERKGRDKDGKIIKNWKGALTNACLAEALRRKTA